MMRCVQSSPRLEQINIHVHHASGPSQTSAIIVFNYFLSSVLLMSLLLDSFLVTLSFRLPVYFMRCLPRLLVPQIFPPNICFLNQSALCMCPKNCSWLFLMVLSRDLSDPAISITCSFDFFQSVIIILIILLMYHISASLRLLSRSFTSVQPLHPCRRMDHI